MRTGLVCGHGRGPFLGTRAPRPQPQRTGGPGPKARRTRRTRASRPHGFVAALSPPCGRDARVSRTPHPLSVCRRDCLHPAPMWCRDRTHPACRRGRRCGRSARAPRRHATGLMSAATASHPSRIASSGIAPPPANGSSTRGARPPNASRISSRNLASSPPVEDPAPSLLLHPLAAGARRFDHPPRHPLQQLAARVPVARIRQQRRQQRRPTRRQRPPRRPDVQRRDVPVPHVLLVDGVEGDLLQRESCLNQTNFI